MWIIHLTSSCENTSPDSKSCFHNEESTVLSSWKNLIITQLVHYSLLWCYVCTQFELAEVSKVILLWPGNEANVQVGENMTCLNVCCHSQKTWELKNVTVIRFTEPLELAYWKLHWYQDFADGLKSCVPAEASTGLVPRPYTQVESGDTSPNPWAHFRI